MRRNFTFAGILLVGLVLMGLTSKAMNEDVGYYWDFRTGFPPNYSGWGNLTLVSEGIQISPGTSYCGLIFCPFTHKPEWIMETLVKVTSIDSHAGKVLGPVSILTRDGPGVYDESTLGIYPNTTTARCRHCINRTDELLTQFTLPFRIQMSVWYKLRFVFYQGRVECYINDVKYFEKSGLHKSPANYTQPHLAVFNGTAIFQYIRIWNLM